ncbi:SDR family oxidoreductase [Sphingobium sp.]|uniref:SDR family oxidoreductase n=1 Tax=Sphingobium sp. TaxID=1912891 RepID=UPI003B3BB333
MSPASATSKRRSRRSSNGIGEGTRPTALICSYPMRALLIRSTARSSSLSSKKWQAWQDSHVTGAFLMVRAAVPLLRQSKGSIVIMASTRAIQSEPDTEAYAAAKGALCALTHALAISLGPDIRVNAILPGWIETRPWAKAQTREAVEHRAIDREQHPVGRVGEPADIAATVLFLASDGAGFITGQQIAVDGGMTRKMIYAH